MVKANKNTSIAKGPSAGYIYQFEVALLQLSNLEENQSISIETLDDVSRIDEKGTYISTIQAKHSISITGKSFANTSEDLWKTFNIWIKNIKDGKLTSKNKFYAISNKKVPKNSLIEKIGKITFDEFLLEIEKIKSEQKSKLDKKINKKENGSSIQKTISRIEDTLSNKKELETIFINFELRDNQTDIKKSVINKMFLGGYTDEQKDNFYHNFLGWIQETSKEFWLNNSEAIFSKIDFDIKFNSLRDIHLLKKLYFRKKELLEDSVNIQSISRNQIFIKQIDDIDRFQKDEIIEEAIINYLCRDIEIAYLISNSSPLTRNDFQKFEEDCVKKWKTIFRSNITKPKIDDYTIDELNQISINIYNEIMYDLKMNFQDDFGFSESNKYIQNGTFLSLSDIPLIGWHPKWEEKYK